MHAPPSCSVIFIRSFLVVGVWLSLSCPPAHGDVFTLVSDAGVEFEVEARLAGSGQGLQALEMPSGRLFLVPDASVRNRKIAPGPTPLDHEAMAQQLTQSFGEEHLRVLVEKPFVVAMVLEGSLTDDQQERRIQSQLKKAARFLISVQGIFLNFVKQVRLTAEPLKYPLVVLIFESEDDFDQYARRVMGSRADTAGTISGFYDSISNYLVLRKSECRTFDVPLHEAIHQQVYNRQIFERLAPVPVWFHEGLATGFEGDGRNVRSGPTQVSARYAKLALNARQIDWADIVRNDKAFGGNVLVGEAYGHAWGLHWLLVTRYKTGYIKYVQQLARKKMLAKCNPQQRLRELEQAVGKSVTELQREFQRAVLVALRRRR